MSEIKNPPPYLITGESKDSGVKMYNLHTPFNPHTPAEPVLAPATDVPVYTSSGGNVGSHLQAEEGGSAAVRYDVGLSRNPGMMTCTACKKQVMTNVTYKAGTYAWLMCLLFICCGLVFCCCLIPFFVKSFKDAHHTCPSCNTLLYVDKKECCK